MKKRKFPTLFFLIVVFLVFSGMTGIFWGESAPGVVDRVALDYFDAINSKEFTKAYYDYTSKEFQNDVSLDSFKKGVRGYTLFEEAAVLQFNKRDVEDQVAFLDGVVKSVHGTSWPISFKLVKEDHEWKIERIEASASVNSIQKQKILDEVKIPVLAQINAIRKNDLKAAYQEATSDEFKRATDFPHFVRFVSSFPVIKKSLREEFLQVHTENDQATLELELFDNDKTLRLVYEIIKQDDAWRIFSFQVIPSDEFVSIKENDLAEIETVVLDYLSLIKQGKVDTAYRSTSQALKAGTSLLEFKTFVDNYDFFKNHESLNVKKWIDITIGKALVEAVSSEGVHFLDFTLFKENGHWTLWGIEIASADNYETSQTEKKAITSLLTLFEEKKMKEAYEHLMTAQFKETTSFEAFNKYFQTEASFALNHKEQKIIDSKVQGDSSVVLVEFILDDGDSEVLEFDLIKELGMWKIVGIKVMETADKELNEDYSQK